MKKLFLLAAFLGSALLAGCSDGGGGETVQVVSADQVRPMNQTMAAAVLGEAFVFNAGVPDFGTTTTTTVTFTPRTSTITVPDTAPANPGFTVTDGTGATANGIVEFGSCRFRVVTSTFPAGHRLAANQEVLVQRCEVNIDMGGAPADSVSRTRSAFLALNTAASTGTPITLNVLPNGNFSINGVGIGTVTLIVVTGGLTGSF